MPDRYATTRRVIRPHLYSDGHSWLMPATPGDDVPVVPDGDGWVLTGSTSQMVGTNQLLVLWFWRMREAKPKYRGCPTPGCGALARKNGKCVGCGKEVGHG